MKKLFILFAAIALVACKSNTKKVHCYKLHVPAKTENKLQTAEILADVFFYVIDNGGSYSYYSSTTPLSPSSYSSVLWTNSRVLPPEMQLEEAEDLGEEEVEMDVDTDSTDDSSSDSDSGDSDSGSDGGGDSGGDGGGGDGGGGGE